MIVNPWLYQLPVYSLLRNDARKTKLLTQGRAVFDFGIGDPTEETPEFIRKALIEGLNAVSQYPTAIGSLAFREACASWVARRFGVSINATGNIISSNGSKESVFHIPQVLFNTNSERRTMIFPDPGYPVYKSSTILNGGTPLEIPLREEDGFVFRFEKISSDILRQTAAVWVCYPHNPTGATVTKEYMIQLYNWALKNNIVLLSDECYVDMYFPGTAKPHSFLEIAANNRFKNLLCFFSLSKRSGMTGYRSGFVAGDADYIAQFAKYRPNAGLGTPDFVQKAAIAAWNDDDHVTARNKIFAQKRAIVDAFFERQQISRLKSNATFYVWAKCPNSYANAEDYAEALAMATGIVVTPGDALGASCKNWFRLALVPDLATIEHCVKVWEDAVVRKVI